MLAFVFVFVFLVFVSTKLDARALITNRFKTELFLKVAISYVGE